MHCPFCKREVKVNQIIRSAHHDLGCVHCFGKPEGETPVMAAEKVVARPRTTGRIASLFSVE
mgnify:CR=1 FL=1